MPNERAQPVEEMHFLFISGKLQVLFGRYMSDRVRSLGKHNTVFGAELSLRPMPDKKSRAIPARTAAFAQKFGFRGEVGMNWSIMLSLMALLSAFLSIQTAVIPVASGVPEEAVGRVVSVISGDALGVQMLISDPRTNNVDSIKLADIASPSTVTPEGKAAQKYVRSLLWNKTVYLDIDNSTTSGRNEWSQLICVVYLVDSEYRPIWPPVNRIIVDAGYAKVNDDKKNEFDPITWWKEPTIPEGEKENLTRYTAEKKATTNATNESSINNTRNSESLKNVTKKRAANNTTNASSINNTRNFESLKNVTKKKAANNTTNASSINNTRIFNSLKNVTKKRAANNTTNVSSINNTRIFNSLKDIAEKKAVTGGRVTVVDTAKSSIMQRDSKTGRVSIGYRA